MPCINCGSNGRGEYPQDYPPADICFHCRKDPSRAKATTPRQHEVKSISSSRVHGYSLNYFPVGLGSLAADDNVSGQSGLPTECANSLHRIPNVMTAESSTQCSETSLTNNSGAEPTPYSSTLSNETSLALDSHPSAKADESSMPSDHETAASIDSEIPDAEADYDSSDVEGTEMTTTPHPTIEDDSVNEAKDMLINSLRLLATGEARTTLKSFNMACLREAVDGEAHALYLAESVLAMLGLDQASLNQTPVQQDFNSVNIPAPLALTYNENEGSVWLYLDDGNNVVRCIPAEDVRTAANLLAFANKLGSCLDFPDRDDWAVYDGDEAVGLDKWEAYPKSGRVFKLSRATVAVRVYGVDDCKGWGPNSFLAMFARMTEVSVLRAHILERLGKVIKPQNTPESTDFLGLRITERWSWEKVGTDLMYMDDGKFLADYLIENSRIDIVVYWFDAPNTFKNVEGWFTIGENVTTRRTEVRPDEPVWKAQSSPPFTDDNANYWW